MKKVRENRNNYFIFFKTKRWLWSCLLFFCPACRQTASHILLPNSETIYQQQIDSTRALLKNGDLIFRNGTDDISQAARSFNRVDTSFSHCGIVLIENDSVFVYHAIGGNYNPDQKLRRDPLEQFCSPGENDRFAIYRYDLKPTETDSLEKIVRGYYRQGLVFDIYFNFMTDDKMYCSEFVFKCLDHSVGGALSNSIRARQWPFGISPDDLFLNPQTRLIKRVELVR